MIGAILGDPLQVGLLSSILKDSLHEQPYESESQMSQDQKYFQIECARVLLELTLHP